MQHKEINKRKKAKRQGINPNPNKNLHVYKSPVTHVYLKIARTALVISQNWLYWKLKYLV